MWSDLTIRAEGPLPVLRVVEGIRGWVAMDPVAECAWPLIPWARSAVATDAASSVEMKLGGVGGATVFRA